MNDKNIIKLWCEIVLHINVEQTNRPRCARRWNTNPLSTSRLNKQLICVRKLVC